MTKDGINCVAISERDHSALIHFVKKEAIDWSIVGPEVPLLNGIVDDFMAEGLKIFGPTKAAALIEGSKSFAKQLMDTYQIPTAKSRSFECYEKAAAYIKENGAPIVVKADGLAAGKGVVVATTVKEALDAAEQMLNQHRFGDSSKKIVVEEFLAGEEFSLWRLSVIPRCIRWSFRKIISGHLITIKGQIQAEWVLIHQYRKFQKR